MSTSLVEITSSVLNFGDKKKAVLLFAASWHEGCLPVQAVLSALSSTAPDVFFGKIDAEQVHELSEKFQVAMVPTIIFLNGEEVLQRMEGNIEPSQVTVAVQRLMSADSGISSTPTAQANNVAIDPEKKLIERLENLIRSDSVVLFMKGEPSAPRCGFSRQAVELLQQHKVPFGSFDILSDEDVRQGLKKHSNWPTYPQIYVNGELIGGLDILKETAEEGPLLEQWGINASLVPTVSPLQERLTSLVKRSHVMIFMKGLPSAPRCGFSRQMIELLDETGAEYDAFNILEDEEVRQGLKEFSKWPTYPQLYVNGELIGGLDICKELAEEGELADVLKQ